MRSLITGAAGFVGSSLAGRLLEQGGEVLGVDCFLDYYPRALKEENLRPLRDHSRFAFREENLLTLDLEEALDSVDVVFHQAAQAGVRASWGADFAIYVDNNILATQRLLEACKGRDIRVVAASSSSVYGETSKLPMEEDDLPQPFSPYGVSKLAAERLCCLYARNYGLHTVSLRYFTVYGPRQRPDMGIHILIRRMLEGQPFDLNGDGTQTRDFTYIADIVEANILAAQRGACGGVYNLGGGSRVSMNEVIAALESILGRKASIRRREAQKGDVTDTYASTERARRDMGFAPRFSLQEGLQAQAEWLADNLSLPASSL